LEGLLLAGKGRLMSHRVRRESPPRSSGGKRKGRIDNRLGFEEGAFQTLHFWQTKGGKRKERKGRILVHREGETPWELDRRTLPGEKKNAAWFRERKPVEEPSLSSADAIRKEREERRSQKRKGPPGTIIKEGDVRLIAKCGKRKCPLPVDPEKEKREIAIGRDISFPGGRRKKRGKRPSHRPKRKREGKRQEFPGARGKNGLSSDFYFQIVEKNKRGYDSCYAWRGGKKETEALTLEGPEELEKKRATRSSFSDRRKRGGKSPILLTSQFCGGGKGKKRDRRWSSRERGRGREKACIVSPSSLKKKALKRGLSLFIWGGKKGGKVIFSGTKGEI